MLDLEDAFVVVDFNHGKYRGWNGSKSDTEIEKSIYFNFRGLGDSSKQITL